MLRIRSRTSRKSLLSMLALIAFAYAFTERVDAQGSIVPVNTPLEAADWWGSGWGNNFYDKAAQDSCGNVYLHSDAGQTDVAPASGLVNGNVVQLYSGGGDWATGLHGGIALDSANNLYVIDDNNYEVIQISASAGCGPVAPVTLPSATYFTQSDLGLTTGYHFGVITVDASGDMFAYLANGSIYERTKSGAYVTVVSALGSAVRAMAVDSSGALYYTIGGAAVYKIDTPAAASAPHIVVSGLVSTSGLTFDKAGNLFIEDTNTGTSGALSTIYEIPYINGASQYNDSHAVATGLSASLELTTGFDGKTVIYVDDSWAYYGIVPGPVNMGSQPVGASTTVELILSFNTSVTPASIAVSGPAGVFTAQAGQLYYNSSGDLPPCTVGTTYGANSACTVTILFSPTTPGVASGSVVLLDANGNQLASAAIFGTGTGAALTIDPGTVNALGGTPKSPSGAVVDQNGNLFVADATSDVVWEYAAGGTTATSLGTGLNGPKGVAVDGAGNVYIADTGNSRIVMLPAVNGIPSTAAQTTLITSNSLILGSSLSAPSAITVDPSGNLYIADTGNSRLLYIPYIGSVVPELAIAFTSGLTSPTAVATDGAGNIFVADKSNGNVYELTSRAGTSSQVTVGSGYMTPTALAVDASGSLVVVDSGNAAVWRIPNLAGTLTASSATNVANQVGNSGSAIIADPYGAAFDLAGNLYITDATNSSVYEITRTVSSQFAGAVAPGTTSSVMSYALESSGNQPLILNNPFYMATGVTSEFSVPGNVSNGCASSQTVAVGQDCVVVAEFAPTASVTGVQTETLQLSSNAANGSSFSIGFSGITGAKDVTTTTVSMTSPAGVSVDFNAAAQFQVAVSSANTPTGTVDLYADGAKLQTATLNGGIATFTVAGGVLSIGSHSITASYDGSVSDAVSTSPVLAITVNGVLTTTAVTTSAASVSYGTSVQYQVAVTGSSTVPGVVDLYVDGAKLQTASLNSSGAATFTVSGGTLSVGSHAIVADYEGSGTFGSSSSTAITTTVTAAQTATTVSFSPAYTNPNSQAAGTPIVLTVSVTAAGAIQPTDGSVTFTIVDSPGSAPNSSNGTITKTVPVGASGTVSYSYVPSQPPSAGSYDIVTISASYSGDKNFLASSSPASTPFDVVAAGGLVLGVPSGTTLTSSATTQSTITFSTTSYGGFNGIVDYSCDPATLPEYAKCIFTPSTVQVAASTATSIQPQAPTVTLKVTIDNPPPASQSAAMMVGGLAGLAFSLVRRRSRRRPSITLAMLVGILGASLTCAISLMGCGSTNSVATPTGQSKIIVYTTAAPSQYTPTEATQITLNVTN